MQNGKPGCPFKLCSRNAFQVYFIRAWKNNITLLQSSACLQGWKEQASGGIITGCNEKHKASLFESPSFYYSNSVFTQCNSPTSLLDTS